MLITNMASLLIEVFRLGPRYILAIWNSVHVNLAHTLGPSFLAILISIIYLLISKPRKVYLPDFACYKPPFWCRATSAAFVEHFKIMCNLEPKSVHFLQRVLERSGLGEETCLPPQIHYIPPNPTMKDSREEAKMIIFSAMDLLFHKTGLDPEDVDVLVVNCSSFARVPSLTDMVISKYKMRVNIKSFNLTGMGCSASVIAIDLARNLLQAHANCNAVVVSTEILSPNNYRGQERSMLVPTCLFRMGGAAILLSNKKSFRHNAKYSLLHVVRTHKGSDDKAYLCAFQKEDIEGMVGVGLSKDLLVAAGEALKSNMTTLGPLVLPASQQFLFLINLLGRKLFSLRWKPYIPDFKQAFEHFCIHAGGRAVIDELQNSLQLSAEHAEASRMTLHRFGNTSSSSLWYELSYIESKGRMKRGDRVWQMAFGSGFKCNSAVWKCNKTIKTPLDGPWLECINRYPLNLPEVVNM